MAVRPFDPVQEMVSLVTLSFRNWLAAVPYVAVALIAITPIFIFGGAGLLSGLMTGAASGDMWGAIGGAVGGVLLGLGLAAIIGLILGTIALAATYVGANDILQGKPVDLSAIVQRGASFFGVVILFGLLACAVLIVVNVVIGAITAMTHGLAGLLLYPLFILALIVVAFFLMYVMPALIVGGRSVTDAISESYRLASTNVGFSLAAVAGLIVAIIGTSIVSGILHFIPVLGSLIGLALLGFYQLFQALVLTRFYLHLSGKSA